MVKCIGLAFHLFIPDAQHWITPAQETWEETWEKVIVRFCYSGYTIFFNYYSNSEDDSQVED